MKRAALLLTIALSSCPCPVPAETWLATNVASYHFDRSADHNERNYGLGIEHGVASNLRVVAGAYRNSLYRTSHYAGANWAPIGLGPVRFGVVAGVVDGYNANGGRFVPVVVPLVVVEQGRVGINALYLPHYKDDSGVIGLQIKLKF